MGSGTGYYLFDNGGTVVSSGYVDADLVDVNRGKYFQNVSVSFKQYVAPVVNYVDKLMVTSGI